MHLRWRVRGTSDQVLSLDHVRWSLNGSAATEVLSDSDTSTWLITTGGARRVPLSGRLAHVTGVNLTLQSVGAGWSWDLYSSNPPDVRIYNRAGDLATAVVDVVAHGVLA